MRALVAIVGGPPVGIEQMLDAREERVARQGTALARFGRPLVSMTLVMPGPLKDGWLQRSVLELALGELETTASDRRWPVLSREVSWQQTGPEALYVIDGEPEILKAATIELEDRHPLGRLWDLDVIAPGPRMLSRKQLGHPERRCLVCDQPARECARSRRHPLERVLDAIARIASDFGLHADA
ncbi:MAG TPA: citrate lyase holo-[acyl-carrier protein] synthase [Candidatus Eisenbacteria bacterium]|nr:citrate lyase holo-[acyl-carrier protein] synthase [Candidatus Eisenbacteria bacterium]